MLPAFDLSYTLAIILFITGLLSGFIDAIVGGGGFIAMPVLLQIGLPPQIALGTNKLQALFGVSASGYHFIKHKKVDINYLKIGVIATAIGAAVGVIVVQKISPSFLGKIIPFLLLATMLYKLIFKNVGMEDKKPKITRETFLVVFGFLLGFYDGFFGPGIGAFWITAFVLLKGFNMAKATVYSKILNMTSCFVSLIFFMAHKAVLYKVGLIMAVGQIIGAKVGSHIVIGRSYKVVNNIFMIAVTLMCISLFYKYYFR